MKIEPVVLTLSVKLDLCDLPEGVSYEQLAKAASQEYYDDACRYSFQVEMLQHAVGMILERAVYNATVEEMYKRHGDERVVDGNATYSLARLNAQNEAKNAKICAYDGLQSVKIEAYVHAD